MNANDLDRRLSDWLGDGPTSAPERSIAAALDHALAHPRRRDPLAVLRRDPMGSSGGSGFGLRALAVVVALGLLLVAALALASVGGLFDQRPVVVPPVNPTSEPSVPVSPSPPIAPSPQVTPSPSLELSPSASATGAAPIVLQRAPAKIGCDSMDPGYRSATIYIDPESDIHFDISIPPWHGTNDRVNVDVWAESDALPSGNPGVEPLPPGTRLAVYWSAAFTAMGGDTPMIRGSRGEEVARDGTRIDQEFTKRTGYRTCLSSDALYVLDYALE